MWVKSLWLIVGAKPLSPDPANSPWCPIARCIDCNCNFLDLDKLSNQYNGSQECSLSIDMSLSWTRSSTRSFITLAPCYFQPGIEVVHWRMEYFLNTWDCCFQTFLDEANGVETLARNIVDLARSSHLRSNIEPQMFNLLVNPVIPTVQSFELLGRFLQHALRYCSTLFRILFSQGSRRNPSKSHSGALSSQTVHRIIFKLLQPSLQGYAVLCIPTSLFYSHHIHPYLPGSPEETRVSAVAMYVYEYGVYDTVAVICAGVEPATSVFIWFDCRSSFQRSNNSDKRLIWGIQ